VSREVFHPIEAGCRHVRMIMHLAVQFYDEFVLWTPEIEHVASYGVLPSEFHAIELASAQRRP
jgi:hypothetical protein